MKISRDFKRKKNNYAKQPGKAKRKGKKGKEFLVSFFFSLKQEKKKTEITNKHVSIENLSKKRAPAKCWRFLLESSARSLLLNSFFFLLGSRTMEINALLSFFFSCLEREASGREFRIVKKRSMTSSREERKRGPLRRIGKLAAVLNTSTAVGKAARLMETVSTRLFDFCIFLLFPRRNRWKESETSTKVNG